MSTERRMPRRLAVAAALALAHAGTARAGPERGLSLGARAGYAIPAGDVGGIPLSSVVAGQIPVQVEVAWRFDPSWRAGTYFRYEPAIIAGEFCPAGASCGGAQLGWGAQAAYAFAGAGAVPWVGAGFGLEWLLATASAGGVRSTVHLFGIQLLDLQAGVDWRPFPGFTVGPVASLGLGEYLVVVGGDAPVRLPAALHEWLRLGVKGTFDL